ncbi:MAG: hypothetical protein J6575_07520 [Bifidobacterium sp.]|nr:hypothetical protein [Bifidobacterium sp.]
MSSDRVVFTASADKHGYDAEDVLYAYTHVKRRRVFLKNGDEYVKFTGAHHGDSLVLSIEVMMRIGANGRVTVFHVNAEQGNFWDKD